MINDVGVCIICINVCNKESLNVCLILYNEIIVKCFMYT